MTSVRFPQIRQGLVDALAVLADPEYQRRVWLEHQSDERGYTWDMAVHALFDDSGLLDPGFEVAAVFRSDEEDAAVRAVMGAIDRVFAEVGTTEAPIQEIVGSSAWQQVVERARRASALIGHDASEAPPLQALLGGFFHQDWRLLGATVADVLDLFIEDCSPAEQRKVRAAIGELLEQDLTEEELQRVLVNAGMAYYPPAFGETYRDFLLFVERRLAAATQ